MARALATLVFIEAGLFPLVVNRDDRPAYIDALEAADADTLAPLIRLFERIEQGWLLRAVSFEVKEEAHHLDQMVEAIADQFSARRMDLPAELEQVKGTADHLHDLARDWFIDLKGSLSKAIEADSNGRQVFVDEGRSTDHSRRSWNRYQVVETARRSAEYAAGYEAGKAAFYRVVETARRFGYFANFRDHQSWVRLDFNTESGRSEILLSFHAVGSNFRGVMAALMCFYRGPQSGDEAGQLVTGHLPVGHGPFQFNHKEPAESAERRFRVWLEEALLEGLGRVHTTEGFGYQCEGDEAEVDHVEFVVA